MKCWRYRPFTAGSSFRGVSYSRLSSVTSNNLLPFQSTRSWAKERDGAKPIVARKEQLQEMIEKYSIHSRKRKRLPLSSREKHEKQEFLEQIGDDEAELVPIYFYYFLYAHIISFRFLPEIVR